MPNAAHSFSARLRSLREQHRLSKTALGKAVGVSTTCVWNWEEGNTEPRIENLVSLGRVFNVSTDYLEFGAGEPDFGRNGRDEVQPVPSQTLAEVIATSKLQIAKLAGIDPLKVKISLDY